MFLSERVDTPELLDQEGQPVEDVERSLRDLRRFNSLAGGVRAFRKTVRIAAPRPASVLDLGSGTSDLIDSLDDVQARIGLDLRIEHLLYGRKLGSKNPILRVVGDAFRLPFPDGSVDVVTSSHLFHHFDARENARILNEALRVARKAAIVSDTRRHIVPWLFTRLLGALRLIGRITRFDAPTSVARGYTVDEAMSVAQKIGARTSVVRIFPYRIGLIARSGS